MTGRTVGTGRAVGMGRAVWTGRAVGMGRAVWTGRAGWVARLLVLALLTGTGLAGCRLPGGAPSGPGFHVTVEFADVLDLVPQAAVKVNDVTVGSVDSIALAGWTARVRLTVDRAVHLSPNAVASIRQTSLLGEKFVALAEPTGPPEAGTLADGAVIPLARTSRSAEVEEVLAALGMLLSGGGLGQLKTINEELATAMRGRESTVDDALRELDTFVAGLDAQRADIVRALDALDSLSAHLAEQRQTVGAALDALGPGLTVLAQQRAQLTVALTSLAQLSTVGVRVIQVSRDDTLASLAALRPILEQLVKAGDSLPRAMGYLLSYPFPPNVTGAISANFVNLHATVDLDGAVILSNLLAAPGGLTQPGLPVPPVNPTLPGLPTPTLPGLPTPTLPGLPTPSLPGVPLPTLTLLPSLTPTLVPTVVPTGCTLIQILLGTC